MKRKASALWKGNLKEGKGTISDGQRCAVGRPVFVCDPLCGWQRHQSGRADCGSSCWLLFDGPLQ